eukprot:CAMPEP_0119371068 /NCGR_PEP_ID=MMETSP1334-20130426/17324_1 /TAXON_ID=127549 /ORGANISM="Calcidiscus leptoporus, Strain RCC1130" /LENGTH=512 /DNA_ID=CAMNT_0007388273 /DNA_START=45 /DNA_END=1583 /DNA_ORIENTATION=+
MIACATVALAALAPPSAHSGTPATSHDSLPATGASSSSEGWQQQQAADEEPQRTQGRLLWRRLQILGWDDLCEQNTRTNSAADDGINISCRAHKRLFARVVPVDLAAACCFFVIAALAMSGGIGGGAVFVPSLTLLLRFTPSVAISLSQSLICGAAMGAFLVNAFSAHPYDPSRPLIDVPLTAFLAPAEMAGAVIGTQLHRALPTALTLGAMVILLTLTAFYTLRKGVRMRAAETDLGGTVVAVEKSNLLPERPFGQPLATSGAPAASASPDSSGSRRTTKRLQCESVALLVSCWIALVLLLLLRGGKGAPSLLGASECSATFWALTLGALLMLAAASVSAAKRLVAKQVTPPSSASRVAEIKWNPASATKCAMQAVGAGVVAGMMGVGGGIVLGPLMLEMGILPQVSTATTATMILLTSSSAAAAFYISGMTPPDYSITFGAVTLAGAYTGKRFVALLLRRYHCVSAIVLLLGFLIAASTLAIGATGIVELQSELQAQGSFAATLALRPFC